MRFTIDALPGIVDGSTTVTFRRWTRPQAKSGGRYRIWGHLIEVDDVRLVATDDITDAEAGQAGMTSAHAVLARLGAEALQDADESTRPRWWRIEFHYIGPDDRIALRNDARLGSDRRSELARRLERMDRASRNGPWTTKTLRLIATYPGVVSTALARQLGHDRPAFKINVRKLKELGLTESLDVGYRLSPLGTAFVDPDPAASAPPATVPAPTGDGFDDLVD